MLICRQSVSLLYYAKLLEQIYVNVSGVPQKVKHYSLMTAAGETSPNLCTVHNLSSVHKVMPPYGVRRQVCTQLHCYLNVGALPQSSGTSAEFIKAVISVYGERRERKAESNGKSFSASHPMRELSVPKVPRNWGRHRAMRLPTEGATACRRWGTTEEGINPHSVYNSEVNWDQNGQQVRLIDQAHGELTRVSLPEYKRK